LEGDAAHVQMHRSLEMPAWWHWRSIGMGVARLKGRGSRTRMAPTTAAVGTAAGEEGRAVDDEGAEEEEAAAAVAEEGRTVAATNASTSRLSESASA
jgi:hypothetical protein